MLLRLGGIVLISFVLGFFMANLFVDPVSVSPITDTTSFGLIPADVPSPQPRIKQEDIKLYKDHVRIAIDKPQWATFTDTNSMDPVLDYNHFALEIVPTHYEDIKVGDIISYQTPQGTVIHRVIQINYDRDGWYAITKGDNLNDPDPLKVRFPMVRRLVVAVIY